MDWNTFLSQEIVQGTICPQTSKSIQLGNILYWDIPRLLLEFFLIVVQDDRRKLQRVVLPLHNTWIEQIKTPFHSSSDSLM